MIARELGTRTGEQVVCRGIAYTQYQIRLKYKGHQTKSFVFSTLNVAFDQFSVTRTDCNHTTAHLEEDGTFC